jgi:glycosyltransferase involved in cell wall biosynthesis
MALNIPDRAECLGVVVIGRNEGARLVRCLASTICHSETCVYVDSGSTDGSIEVARAMGAEVVQLDMRKPFNAGRARNAGFARLGELGRMDLVQFVDGDCELVPGWLERASAFLRSRPDVVATAGRRRERFPDATVFNRLCDIEWDTPVGDVKAIGGDALFRVAALRAAGGFRDDLIAGEEPELCVRLRAAGGRVWRLDEEMTLHDAAMTRWSQWWSRNVRSGHAFAEGAHLHGRSPERHFAAETRRALLWGAALPMAILALALASPWFLALALVYPLQWLRIGRRFARARTPIAWRYAAFLVLARFPEAWGVLKFSAGRLSGHRSGLIEYK